jgi:hypothetical protein
MEDKKNTDEHSDYAESKKEKVKKSEKAFLIGIALFVLLPAISLATTINRDNAIDVLDLNIVTRDFGKTSGFSNAESDTNHDSIVDIFDIVYVASRFS